MKNKTRKFSVLVILGMFLGVSLLATMPIGGELTITETKITASDGAASDWFGLSASIDGDTAIVGAKDDDDAGSKSGSAYVYVRDVTTGVWSEQAKLTANDATVGDQFGFRVSVDGDTAVIGAVFDDRVASEGGSAYVFVRSGSTWTQQAKLTASDGGAGDWFGVWVSIDGDTALIGSYGDDHSGKFNAGSAYVFVRSGTTWTQQTKLTASDAKASDRFGIPVCLNGDTALIGSSSLNEGRSGSNPGSAYVFVRDVTTGVWSEQAKLTASDGVGGDAFGVGLSISGDTALIGARLDDDKGTDSGSAYIFVRSGTT
jgi:hypothetical protein